MTEERRLLEPIRDEADVVIDTCDLSLRELRERIFAQVGSAPAPDRLAIQLISFGFKYGVPARGRPRLRRPVHGQPVLRRRAAPASAA